MKVLASFLGLVSIYSSAAFAQSPSTDWSQPPLACIEDVMPHASSQPCPDLSQVVEIAKELKDFASPEVEAFWKAPENKKALNYCRSLEILRRHEQSPGSVTNGSVQISWMRVTAVQNSSEKLAAVLNANAKYKIPAFVLLGALTQESLFSDLGITDDGGNFSCGVGQINVLEWCRWANKQSVETKARLGWANDATCEGLTTESLRPFHELATQNMQGLPGYRLSREHFKNITFNDVQNKVPGANLVQKKKNYALIQSFIGNCGKPLYGIDAKAHELASLFRNHVPAGIKNREVYPAGKKFEQNCKYRDQSGVYPLHTGWLMAVAAYNAGPRATETVSHYYDLTRADLADVKQMSFLNPVRLVEGLFMGGKFNAVTGRIDFTTSAGLDTSNPAFKQCVMHQHVVRIVQHVTKAGVPPLVKTLNEIEGCSAANPLPESRLRSSGRL